MARKPRVWYPGAVYHIMCRGNNKNDIFHDDRDRNIYLYLLRKTKESKPFFLHCYCLMSNHVHLLIETIDINISTIMKEINMSYSIYYNKQYEFVGHLFQGRYRSELIEDARYLWEVSRYIHLNPVRSGLTDQPIDYNWSSYRDYMGIRDNRLVTTQRLLACFDELDLNAAIKHYREFVEVE